jgi:SAM-dependent methyltransferase
MSDASDPREIVSRLIRQAISGDDPTAWFEQLYARAEAGEARVPWAMMRPNPLLTEWLDQEAIDGAGKRALVVGCGLGDDAQAFAGRGFATTAFDISPTAIAVCQRRFPDSAVDYQAVDLFQPPGEWRGAFDFVFESRTIQALPWELCEPAIAQIAAFVAPRGSLLALCFGRDPQEDRRGIPWPLSRVELAAFQSHGLNEAAFEDLRDHTPRQFRILYQR